MGHCFWWIVFFGESKGCSCWVYDFFSPVKRGFWRAEFLVSQWLLWWYNVCFLWSRVVCGESSRPTPGAVRPITVQSPAFWSDINQPSLPTPFCSVLVSISAFMALSTVFHSINSPDNCFLLFSSGLISASLVLSAICLFMEVSFSPDIIPNGWLGSEHQLTNYLTNPERCTCRNLSETYVGIKFVSRILGEPVRRGVVPGC